MGDVRNNALSQKAENSVLTSHAQDSCSKKVYEEPSVELVVLRDRAVELFEDSTYIDQPWW